MEFKKVVFPVTCDKCGKKQSLSKMIKEVTIKSGKDIAHYCEECYGDSTEKNELKCDACSTTFENIGNTSK